MTIKVPVPKGKSQFGFRRAKRLSAFYSGAPRPPLPARSVFRNLSAFYDAPQSYPLPAPGIFHGLGAFYEQPDNIPTPVVNVFRGGGLARVRGVGRVRRLRGLGQDESLFSGNVVTPADIASTFGPGPDYATFDSSSLGLTPPIITLTPAVDGASAFATAQDLISSAGSPQLAPSAPAPITLTPPSTPDIPTGPVGGGPSGPSAPTAPSSNPALDAFNAALAASVAIGKLTSAQVQQLSQTAGTSTPAQLAAATAQLKAAAPGSSIFSSLSTWLAGTTTLTAGGTAYSNSSLVLGGGAVAILLVVLSQMGGKKKGRR